MDAVSLVVGVVVVSAGLVLSLWRIKIARWVWQFNEEVWWVRRWTRKLAPTPRVYAQEMLIVAIGWLMVGFFLIARAFV